MIVTIFKNRLRPGVGEEYGKEAGRLAAIAQKMPGFVSIKGYTAADGEELVLVEFEDEKTLAAWRNHPEHLVAQERGRKDFYAEYQIQVCNVLRGYGFNAKSA